MGLFDAVSGALAGGDGAGANPVVDIVMKLIADPKVGGLPGLIKLFQDGGLGQQVASWVGTGANLPISADQIANVFAGGQLRDIASKLGVSESAAAGNLAAVLPNLIDTLTPNGHVPEGDLMAQGLSMLKGKLFG